MSDQPSMTRKELMEALRQQDNAVDLILRAGVQYGAFLYGVGVDRARQLKRLVGASYMGDALVLAAIRFAYQRPLTFNQWIKSELDAARTREGEESDE